MGIVPPMATRDHGDPGDAPTIPPPLTEIADPARPSAAEEARTIAAEAEDERPIGILVDLQGPKLRVGTFAGGSAILIKGEPLVLDTDPTPGDARRVQCAIVARKSERHFPKLSLT